MKTKQKRIRKSRKAADKKSPQQAEPVTAAVKTEDQTAVTLASQPESEERTLRKVARYIGLADGNLALQFIEQADRLQSAWPVCSNGNATRTVISLLSELKPESAMEAMLATQMISVHNAAVVSLQRATFHQESSKNPDMHMDRANKLMRLFVKQLDAMARLKGKTGQQRVEVTHVHLNAGAQAVIGTVSTAGPRQGEGGSNDQRNKTP